MAASSRKTRNYKEKNSMLAFGNFALPLAALVALGMLFIGIKLFFLTPPDRGGIEVLPQEQNAVAMTPIEEPIPIPVESEPPAVIVETPLQESVLPADSSVLLAGPLGERNTGGATTSASRPSSSGAQTSTARPAGGSSSARASGSWGVQIGAFTKAEGAATLREQASKEGYEVVVTKADVSGTTYHRVRVVAGNSRESAVKLASELEKKGYPIQVTQLK